MILYKKDILFIQDVDTLKIAKRVANDTQNNKKKNGNQAQEIHLWSERGRSNGGAGAENPLVDQVQISVHLKSRCLKVLNIKQRL